MLCACFREGVGKMEVFDMSHFGVLLAGIDLYNVYECVPVVKTRPGPHGSLCNEAFYKTYYCHYCHDVHYFKLIKIINNQIVKRKKEK